MAFGFTQGAFPDISSNTGGKPRNNNIRVDFDFNDFQLGFKLIGTAPKNIIVEHAVIIVYNQFNNGSKVTVGDDTYQAVLMNINDSKLHKVNTYITDPNYEYTSDINIKIFFPVGTPTQGSGRVIIYF